jgi:DNA modification methylase
VGFELNPDYCRIAEERLKAWAQQPSLFTNETAPATAALQ